MATQKLRAFGLAAMLGLASTQFAAAATCTSVTYGSFADFATADGSGINSGCLVGSTTNDKIGAHLRVNRDSLYGVSNWTALRRIDRFGNDLGTPLSAVDFSYSPLTKNAGLFGDFAVDDNLFDSYGAYMIVMKSKSANTEPDGYVAYRFTQFDGLTGSLDSPFWNTDKDKQRRSVQFTLYGLALPDSGPAPDPGPTPAPLPAGVVLLATGLAGLGIAGRRRKAR